MSPFSPSSILANEFTSILELPTISPLSILAIC